MRLRPAVITEYCQLNADTLTYVEHTFLASSTKVMTNTNVQTERSCMYDRFSSIIYDTYKTNYLAYAVVIENHTR